VESSSDGSGATSANSALRIFPNPAQDRFTLWADFVGETELANVLIYGARGDLAMTGTMRGPIVKFDTCGLGGLYLIVVESAGVRHTAKLVIQ